MTVCLQVFGQPGMFRAPLQRPHLQRSWPCIHVSWRSWEYTPGRWGGEEGRGIRDEPICWVYSRVWRFGETRGSAGCRQRQNLRASHEAVTELLGGRSKREWWSEHPRFEWLVRYRGSNVWRCCAATITTALRCRWSRVMAVIVLHVYFRRQGLVPFLSGI